MALKIGGFVATIPEETVGRYDELWTTSSFGSRVTSAVACINGFKLEYDQPEGGSFDRSIRLIEVDLDFVNIPEEEPDIAIIRVQCQLADRNRDDAYHGTVAAQVIANVE
jgi:hypothetical protein